SATANSASWRVGLVSGSGMARQSCTALAILSSHLCSRAGGNSGNSSGGEYLTLAPPWVAIDLAAPAARTEQSALRAPAQEPNQVLRICERLESERRLDDRVLLAARHRRGGELAELLDDVGSGCERVLAAARRLARFALDRPIAQVHIDAHHVTEARAARG